MEKSALLRGIPKIDELLRHPELAQAPFPTAILTDLARQTTEALRGGILSGETRELPSKEALCQKILGQAYAVSTPSLREVINATGITLHTNLGRACLSEAAAQAAFQAARRYSTLEHDPNTGSRGSRHDHVCSLLCRLTGAEDALVVNNNAAAVLLILSAIGSGGEIITSRGELVEIGGSFRMPEIMEQCGCRLREVGATNKTHLRDYRSAITPETRALLKVHTSNYRIMGFSESVPLADLVALGMEYDLPVIEDLGSGCLIDLEPLGIHDEPTVMNSVNAGVDVLSFSGDKLLGGPQAGIILGKARWIEPLKSHPLARAVRVDKMTLAALEATLRTYLDPQQAIQEIPTLRMLSAKPEMLKKRAETLCALIRGQGAAAEVLAEQTQVGGGSVPCQLLPAYVVAVLPASGTVNDLEAALRKAARPIIGRIHHDRYLLDVRTLWDEDFAYLAQVVGEAAR